MNISLIEVRNRVIRSIIHSYPIITQPNRAYAGTHPLSPLGKPAPRAPRAPRTPAPNQDPNMRTTTTRKGASHPPIKIHQTIYKIPMRKKHNHTQNSNALIKKLWDSDKIKAFKKF